MGCCGIRLSRHLCIRSGRIDVGTLKAGRRRHHGSISECQPSMISAGSTGSIFGSAVVGLTIARSAR